MIGFASPARAARGSRPTEIMARFEIVDEAGRAVRPPRQLPSRAVFAGRPSAAKVTIRYRTGQVGPVAMVDRAGPSGHRCRRATSSRRSTSSATSPADREADERRRFLLRAVDELNSSLDYERTLAAVARLAVPVLADWCARRHRRGRTGETARDRRTSIPNKLAAAIAELARRYPPDPSSRTGVHEIVRTGEAQLIPRSPRELLTAAARRRGTPAADRRAGAAIVHRRSAARSAAGCWARSRS